MILYSSDVTGKSIDIAAENWCTFSPGSYISAIKMCIIFCNFIVQKIFCVTKRLNDAGMIGPAVTTKWCLHDRACSENGAYMIGPAVTTKWCMHDRACSED